MVLNRVSFIIAILLFHFVIQAYAHPPCQPERTAYENQRQTVTNLELLRDHNYNIYMNCETGLYYLLRKCTPIPRPMDMVACLQALGIGNRREPSKTNVGIFKNGRRECQGPFKY